MSSVININVINITTRSVNTEITLSDTVHFLRIVDVLQPLFSLCCNLLHTGPRFDERSKHNYTEVIQWYWSAF